MDDKNSSRSEEEGSDSNTNGSSDKEIDITVDGKNDHQESRSAEEHVKGATEPRGKKEREKMNRRETMKILRRASLKGVDSRYYRKSQSMSGQICTKVL